MGELKINCIAEYPSKIYLLCILKYRNEKGQFRRRKQLPFFNFKFLLVKGIQKKTTKII